MRRARVLLAVGVAVVAASSLSLRAEVKADQKVRVEFAGALGKVVNFFGGKAAREGVTSTVAVKGDRKATTTDTHEQIIDLAEEKVYDVDLGKKSYKVTTFEEIRRKMEEDRRKAEEQSRKDAERSQKAEKNQEPQKEQKEMEVDFDVKETGQKKTVNGFDTKEVVMTIAVREKGKTLEQSGGIVLTSDMWMAPTIAAMKEIGEFDRRYAQKIAGPYIEGTSPEQMAMALAQYPAMKDAIAKMRNESGSLSGTPIATTTTFDAVKSAEQMAQEKQQKPDEEQPSAQGGVSGMLGGFAKKMAKKKSEGSDEPKARMTIMTLNNEVLKVAPAVAAADVAIPAGFQQK